MHPSWKVALKDEFEKPYFKKLSDFVKHERSQAAVYPPHEDVFAAFETPYEDISVVILGQDPYHGAGQAHGLSFSVRPGVKPPPSLANIYKELAKDVGFKDPGHGSLQAWAKQGVFLLNTTLTVRAGNAGSHQGQGWEEFTDAVIRRLNDCLEPIVFLLWGKHAQAKANLINTGVHGILCTPHPSPFSAHTGFFGSRCFTKVNEFLVRKGAAPIDWQLPKDPNETVPRPIAQSSRKYVDINAVLRDQFPG